jgi:murein DD-endopeptidase MepM/ murein hydrolase activator NlpD
MDRPGIDLAGPLETIPTAPPLENRTLMLRRLLFLIALTSLPACTERGMSAECKAVLKLPPTPLLSMLSNSSTDAEGNTRWSITHSNPGILPLIYDLSRDSSGFATAPILNIEPGASARVFSATTPGSQSAIEVPIPRLAFARSTPVVPRQQPPITMQFPINPQLAHISQSPRDGTDSLRGRSHTAATGTFEAVDIDAPMGTLIEAPVDGVVAYAYHDSPDVQYDNPRHSPYANVLYLVTADDVTVSLAHLAKGSIRVEPGAHVRRGQPVARVGRSGSGHKPHLHLVAHALGPQGIDSIPIRFEPCGAKREVWEPRNGRPCS